MLRIEPCTPKLVKSKKFVISADTGFFWIVNHHFLRILLLRVIFLLKTEITKNFEIPLCMDFQKNFSKALIGKFLVEVPFADILMLFRNGECQKLLNR